MVKAAGAGLSRALWIVVQNSGVLDEDTVADLLVGCPHEEQIKQHSVIRFLFTLGRVRPVAAPYATFRSGFRIGLRDVSAR